MCVDDKPLLTYSDIIAARLKIEEEFDESPVEIRMRPDFFLKLMKGNWVERLVITSSPNTRPAILGMRIIVDRRLVEEWRMFTQKELDKIKEDIDKHNRMYI